MQNNNLNKGEKMTKQQIAEQLLIMAKSNQMFDLDESRTGVWLESKESLIAQDNQSDFDGNNWSKSDVWLITDNGINIPILDANDLQEECAKYDINITMDSINQ